MKLPHIFLVGLLAGIIPAQAQNITNFGDNVGYGPIVGPDSGWTYDGSTSTLGANNTNGSSLIGTFPSTMDFTGSNVITLTGNATAAPGSSFLLTLFDQTNGTASAVFTWEQLLFGATVTSSMTPLVPGTMQNVNSWRLLSIYNGGSPAPIDVTFSSAVASYQTPAATGIGGPVLTSFGTAATATGTWAFTQATNTLSGTPGFGDTLAGGAAVTNYSSATQISLTASAPGVSNAPFTYVLTDNDGDQAYAAFDWSSFSSGPKTVTADLVTTTFFDSNNITSWQILSGTDDVAIGATLYGAGLVSSAQNETVLDDFSVGATPIVANNVLLTSNSTVTIEGWTAANREMTASAGSDTQLTAGVVDGIFETAGVGPNQKFSSLDYTNFSLYTPDQRFLQIDFTETYNLNFLSVILTSSNSSINLEDIISITDGGIQSYFLDLTTMAASAGVDPSVFLAGLTEAQLIFATTDSEYFAKVDRVLFTTVPEPSVVTLLLCAGLGFCMRRRR